MVNSNAYKPAKKEIEALQLLVAYRSRLLKRIQAF
jgi:hypothetical protein